MDWTWYLFRFNGRINRAKLWLAWLVMLGLMMSWALAIVAIHSLFGAPHVLPFRRQGSLQAGGSRRVSVADIGRPSPAPDQAVGTSLLMWVYFATSIKRLHDRDKSGWWMVPFFVGARPLQPVCGPAARFLLLMLPLALVASGLVPVGLHRNVLPEGLAQDQPVRRRPADAASAARHAAALGPAERDRNGAAQGWPAAGLAC